MGRGLLKGLGCLWALGCGHGLDTESTRVAVIYGDDDRVELDELADPQLAGVIRASVVALIPLDRLSTTSTAGMEIDASSAGETFELCEGERFARQPSAAVCSGVLVEDDLVLTAGHCIRDHYECIDALAFVFDYAISSSSGLDAVSTADVYRCSRLRHHRWDAIVDVALVELDRPVDRRRFPPELGLGPLDPSIRYVLAGHGLGLPLKVDPLVEVLDENASAMDVAYVAADAFGGGSGGGLFDPDGRLVAYAVRGEIDLVRTADGCNASRHVANDCSNCLGAGEHVAYVGHALAHAEPTVEPPHPSPLPGGTSCGAVHPRVGGASAFPLLVLVSRWTRLSRRARGRHARRLDLAPGALRGLVATALRASSTATASPARLRWARRSGRPSVDVTGSIGPRALRPNDPVRIPPE